MKEFLEFIIRQLVEFPDDMVLTEIPNGKMTIFKVQLRQSDVGRIIGRNGQTIHAIRAMLNSSASRHGQRPSRPTGAGISNYLLPASAAQRGSPRKVPISFTRARE